MASTYEDSVPIDVDSNGEDQSKSVAGSAFGILDKTQLWLTRIYTLFL